MAEKDENKELNEIAKNAAKDVAKKGVKAAVKSVVMVVVTFVIKHLALVLVLTVLAPILFTFLNYAKEYIQGEHSVEQMYKVIEQTDISELIELKGNDKDGYYWGFVEDIDSKLDKIISRLSTDANTVTIEDKELLKKMIKAEAITQYPDLGGKYFASSTKTYSGTSEQKANLMMEDLTLEQKVSQMLFLVTSNNKDLSKGAGGYVLENGFNFSNAKSSIENAENDVNAIFAVDEEGGTVQRALTGYPDAREYGDSRDYDKLRDDCASKAKSLMEMGINMNLAPVADMVSDENAYMYKRSFSGDYEISSLCVESAVKAMKENGLITSLKHFPGYGNATDTHSGSYTDTRTKDEIQQNINVFKRGIDAGATTVMVSHITQEAIDPDNPASLSAKVINQIRSLNFKGVIITDALNMGALEGEENIYVRAVKAGNDVLEVTDFDEAKKQILDAVDSGDIDVKTINESVKRILTLKFEYDVIDLDEEQQEEFEDTDVPETGDNFQGAIHLRRVMPDKAIGELTNVSTGVSAEKKKYVATKSTGLGTKENIPDSIKEKMDGVSMNGISGVSYNELSYLTIKYYDLAGNIQKGNMIVNKILADEVLLIFQELYNAKYPIQRMDTVEELKNEIDEVDFGDDENSNLGTKLSITSKWHNNTYSFNDFKEKDGTVSAHATGTAIDINPLINPKVIEKNYSPLNAEKYTDRKGKKWTDEEKNAAISKDSEIYKIFTKYGWTWSGDNSEEKDYSHFVKKDLTDVTEISSVEYVNGTDDAYDKGQEQGQVAGDGKQYVVAVAAGHNFGGDRGASSVTPDGEELNEEELTVNVAEYVEQMLSIYSNIKVVQTGTTRENTTGVTVPDRVPLAKQANADVCVQIHFNAAEGTYTSANTCLTICKVNDNASKKLAETVLSGISSSLGIPAGGILEDPTPNYNRNLTIIANSSDCGFANIVTEGAFINNKEHQAIIRTEDGQKKYAKGIVDGILEYLSVANVGYGNTGLSTGIQQANAGIRSKIFDLKYVSNNKFEEDVKNNKEDALKEFTIDDESKKIKIATWSYGSDSDPKIKIEEKSFQPSKTYTQKYTMPIEYLFAYYIDTRNKEFVSDLAELAIDSEFVLAVQDNVTTSQTDITTTQHWERNEKKSDGKWVTTSGDKNLGTESTLRETVSTTVELTYGDTWFVKFYKDVNYSKTDLSSTIAQNGATLTGDEGDFIGDFKITTYCKWCNSPKNSLETAAGVDATPNHTIAVHTEYFNGNAVNGLLKKGSQVIINGQVYTVEDTGDISRNRPDNWIDVFIDGGDVEPARESDDPCNFSLLNSESTPVYVAKNVTEASKSTSSSKVANSKRVNTVAVIKGYANIQDVTTTQTDPTEWETETDENGWFVASKKTETTRTTRVRTNTYKYTTGEMHVIGNEQKFTTIYRKNDEFRNDIKPEWLFMVLGRQTKTSSMIDLTKYLIYMANLQKSEYDYGIVEFDFSIYAPESFSNMRGIYGNTIQEKVWFALRGAGYSEIATAGAMGSIEVESGGFNPDMIEAGTGEGIGLCQWSGDRKIAFKKYAESKGVEWTDLNTQIEFLLAELTPGGGANGYATYQLMTNNGYSPSDWINAQDVDVSAQAFCWTFERPSIPHMDRRIAAANKYYNEFKGRTAPVIDERIGPIMLSGENANKMADMLTEALRIADDDRYTYSQENRYGEFQYDCSSLVERLYEKYFDIDVPSTTYEYTSQYLVGAEGAVELQPGDVLWRSEHVEIYIGNGLRVGAHTSNAPAADQISVKEYTPGYFTYIYRFIE